MTDRRWAVTCDPGVDDAIALAVAATRADCDLRAVVAGAGNVDAPTAWRNATGLAALFGLDVPVGLGSAVALDGGPLGRGEDSGSPGSATRRAGDSRHASDSGHGSARHDHDSGHRDNRRHDHDSGHRDNRRHDHDSPHGDNGHDTSPHSDHNGHDTSPHSDDSAHGSSRHGRDGLAGLSDRLPEVSATPVDGGPLVRGQVIALGPLTDVARSLRAGRPLDRVVWMGGTIGWMAGTTAGPGDPGAPRVPPASRALATGMAAVLHRWWSRARGTQVVAQQPIASQRTAPALHRWWSRARGTQVVAQQPIASQRMAPPPSRPDRPRTGPASPDVPAAPTRAAGPGGPAWEFNASADVAAVDAVLGSGLDLSIVPIDVTRQVTLDQTALDRWDAGPPAAQLCAALARTRLRSGRPGLHDPVAVIAALEPDLFAWQTLPLRGSGGDAPRRGSLVPAPERRAPTRIAIAVDAAAVRQRIVHAVLALPA